ncbi:hypothetical protein C8F04DRAFT_1336823 [Mycena alexandri]|uniref:Galactose oxidase n=1 Tax=Mycena alexandri TaxID=1745969 RepID=A0AAD6RYK7_9AGAR|nr:hypothetical protein C8F04DRAFT_1336823 [Mycena alexandri]
MTLFFYIALLISAVHSYAPAPRWGQATSLITDSLFVQGGKQDPYNSMGYDSALAQDDLLYLPLGSSWSADSPPWQLVDPNNTSNSPGPVVAWHTLSAYNSSMLLVFGGMPSPTVPLATQPDSGWLLDVNNTQQPQFTQEPSAWGGEPIRRIHHTAVSSTTGEVYIFGGEKADGSREAFSDHYVFNPNTDSFALLPTDNAPPALTGHASIILPNGQILIFGGLSSEGLLPFNTLYIFDTKTNSWSSENVSYGDVPQGRRAFASTLLDETTLLIHGGCDGVFQNVYSDGWIYNITNTTWTSVSALEALGQRMDHFAVTYGEQVLFGFDPPNSFQGYGASGPANASLAIFNPTSESFQPTFIPPPPTTPVSPTIPIASASSTNPGQTFSITDSITGSVHPTSTGGSTGGGSGGGGGNGGGGDANGKPESATSKTTVIAIGTVLGIAALVAAGLGAVWYMRRQQRHRWAEGGVGGVFSPLRDEEGGVSGADGAGGTPPAARMFDAPPSEKSIVGGAVESVGATLNSWGVWIAGALGIGGVLGAGVAATERDKKQRRDMLADEDAQEFGWYEDGDGHSSRLGRFRQASGGSSWSLMSVFRPKPRRQGSSTSGMSFGSRILSRGGSLLGHTEGPSEKDPFRDDMYLRDAAAAGGAGVLAAASRPQGRRQTSYASVTSVGSNNYIDPFADPLAEQDIAGPGSLLVNLNHGYSRAGPLSPVTEISRLSSSDATASRSGSSNDHGVLSPFSTVSRSSFGFSSNSHHGSPALPLGASPAASPGLSSHPPRPQPRTTSILDMKPPQPDQPMQRSNTWWARFSSRSLLDRRSSRGSGTGAAAEIRDPNPLPQRLGFVEEETPSVLRERSDGSDISRVGPPASVYGRGRAGHGKSMSSIQTQQTADSEALERMGGNVDVIVGARARGGSDITHGESIDEGQARRSLQASSDVDEPLYTSPVEMVPASAFGLPSPPKAREMVPASAFGLPSPPPARESSPPVSPSRPALSTNSSSGSSSGAVSDRIKAYERRMSQDISTPPPPTNTKQREERTRKKHTSNYGLVPRASLFVANPDHGFAGGSGDS